MRRRALIIGIFVFGITAAVVVILEWVDLHRYRSQIADQLSQVAGRKVGIHGPLSLDIGLMPTLEVEEVTLANAPGQSPPEMARIGHLWLELDPWQLLHGEIALRDLRVSDAEILLEWNQEGRPNWPSPGSAPREEKEGGGLSFDLRNMTAENLTIRLHQVASGNRRMARIERLSIAREKQDETIEVAASGVLEGIPFDLSGATGTVSDLVLGDFSSPIALKGKVLDLDVVASGTIGGAEQRGDYDLRVSVSAPGIVPIGHRFDLELPELGPVVGSGKLNQKGGIARLSEILVEVGRQDTGWAKVTGEIGDLLRMQGVELEAAFRSESLRHLSPLVGQRAPEIGALEGTARLTDHDGTLGIEEFGLHGGHEEVLRIEVTGAFGHLRELAEIGVRADLQAKDLSVIGDLFDVDLPSIGPVEISGRVEGDRGHAEIREMQARLDKTHFTGEVRGSFASGERPHLAARLTSPRIHLDDVGLAPRKDERIGTPQRAAERTESDALPFDRLHRLDADVSLQAGRVVGRAGLLVEQVEFALKLEDGNLVVGPVTLEFEGGSFTGDARIDARTEQPRLALHLEGTDMNLGRALAQIQERPVVTGLADLSLNLETRGASVPALREALGGDAGLAIHEGQLYVSHLGLVAQDLTGSLIRGTREGLASTTRIIVGGFTRSSGNEEAASADAEPIQCFVADFGIDDGIATARVLALDTGEIVLLGGGQVDLVQEIYDLHLEPRVKQQSLFAVTIPLDVHGPLNRPKVSPSLVGAPRTTATGFLGNLIRPGAALLPFVDAGLWQEKSCADLREELSR